MKKLRDLREASGLTQLEVSRRTHIDRTRVSLWESGYVQLSSVEEQRIQAVLLDAAKERAEVIRGAIQDFELVHAEA